MIDFTLKKDIEIFIQKDFPLPGLDKYETRLNHFFEYGSQDLSLAKIMEAHWDAIAILAEANKKPKSQTLYAVWTSEIPNAPLKLEFTDDICYLTGKKMFCSGTYLADRALISADKKLIDIDLKKYDSQFIQCDVDLWSTKAFSRTNTCSIQFNRLPFNKKDILGENDWYIKRPGFWQGALGPAACWGGGANGLVEYAKANSRNDAHTLAHLAAMESNIFTIKTLLSESGKLIDLHINDNHFAEILALKIRHSIEQLCSDILRRFARAYGPFPLSCNESIVLRYHELDLFLRQHHAERDLEKLGLLIKKAYEEKK